MAGCQDRSLKMSTGRQAPLALHCSCSRNRLCLTLLHSLNSYNVSNHMPSTSTLDDKPIYCNIKVCWRTGVPPLGQVYTHHQTHLWVGLNIGSHKYINSPFLISNNTCYITNSFTIFITRFLDVKLWNRTLEIISDVRKFVLISIIDFEHQ